MDNHPKDVTILLVEDDEVDILAFKRSLQKLRILNPVRTASDGVEALDILRGTGGQAILERPYIILLDINMPRMNGLEFLEALRDDEDLHSSVVFVLTTSDNDKDITRAYASHIAGYIVKMTIGEDFQKLIEMLGPYWRIVALPSD